MKPAAKTTSRPRTRGSRKLPPPDDPGRIYVEVQRPRCPACGTLRLRGYGTIPNGDSTATRYTACVECGFRFLVVLL